MTKTITDILRPFLVVLFIFGFGLLTACGGGGGNTAAIPTMPGMTMTTMPPPPPEPVVFALDAQEIGGLEVGGAGRSWFVFLSVAAEGQNTVIFGRTVSLQRQMINRRAGFITPVFTPEVGHLPAFNRTIFHATNDLVPVVNGNATVALNEGDVVAVFQTRPTITMLAELCPVSWIAAYISARVAGVNCPQMSGLSYTPNMPNVLHAVLADGFNRGIGIGESRFAFSGRHNGNDRAAGFTYDMGSFAVRTDYVHLPSKQDGGVFLDTYRFGIVRPINDETRFFAGVDSYRNAILALDVNGDNLHRFGIAAGDGYAVQYELRIRL